MDSMLNDIIASQRHENGTHLALGLTMVHMGNLASRMSNSTGLRHNLLEHLHST